MNSEAIRSAHLEQSRLAAGRVRSSAALPPRRSRVPRDVAASIVLLGLLLASCKKRENYFPDQPKPPKEEPKDESCYGPGQYPEESYADAELAKEPRLQFLWMLPGEEDDSIWSMKVDGTDLRKVVDSEALQPPETLKFPVDRRGVASRDAPARSPNGRYIAYVFDYPMDQLRVIIDLKTKEVRSMQGGCCRTSFNWTPDSKEILIRADAADWSYQPESRTLTELPPIYGMGIYLVDNGKQLLSFREDAIDHYDRKGKKLKSTPLPIRLVPDATRAVSPDGRTFMLESQGGAEQGDAGDGKWHSIFVAIDATGTARELWRDDQHRPGDGVALSSDGRTLYSLASGGRGGPAVYALDVARKTERRIACFGGLLEGLSFIPARRGR